jgi:hypothetical protein
MLLSVATVASIQGLLLSRARLAKEVGTALFSRCVTEYVNSSVVSPHSHWHVCGEYGIVRSKGWMLTVTLFVGLHHSAAVFTSCLGGHICHNGCGLLRDCVPIFCLIGV